MVKNALVLGTNTRSTQLWVQRFLQGSGVNVITVADTAEAICDALLNTDARVVVVDALTTETAPLRNIQAIIRLHQEARIIVAGKRPDLGFISGCVRAGAWDYVTPYVTVEEFHRAVFRAIQGQAMPSDTLVGRVRSCIPVARRSEDDSIMADGSVVSLSEAVIRCSTLGLTPAEIAQVTELPSTTVDSLLAKINNQRRTFSGQSSLFGKVIAALLRMRKDHDEVSEGNDAATGTSAKYGQRFVFGVPLAVALTLGLVASQVRGCALREPYQYIPCRGTVAYEDETLVPVEYLVLTFHPQREVEDRQVQPRRASAFVQRRTGKFNAVTSHKPGDGLMACRYRVTLHQPSRVPLSSTVLDESYADATRSPLFVEGGLSVIKLRVAKPRECFPPSEPALPVGGL